MGDTVKMDVVFTPGTLHVLSVPHEERERREAEYRKGKPHRRGPVKYPNHPKK
jgi:hypothetical protein